LDKTSTQELDGEEEDMQTADIRTQWEGAAPGWARWEATIATWMEPATEAMLAMAGVDVGARVLDLASGAGSQTLRAAQRVGAQGTSSRATLPTRCCTMCKRTLAPLV
jgi:cyclopropane fatty-acyl-phospholipid synthase-like methyltransferase